MSSELTYSTVHKKLLCYQRLFSWYSLTGEKRPLPWVVNGFHLTARHSLEQRYLKRMLFALFTDPIFLCICLQNFRLFYFSKRRDMIAGLPIGHEKSLIYQIAVLIARKVKIVPSSPLVVAVSPLNVLISDQVESCQRINQKAVKMEQELFDNDDKLKELEEQAGLLQSGNLGKHPIQAVPFKDGRLVD